MCPIDKALKVSAEQKAYAAVHKDDEVLAKSTSGGAFTAIADAILERVLDGLDYAALACIHGRPAAYLRTRYHRAKKQLAQRLKEGEHYEV